METENPPLRIVQIANLQFALDAAAVTKIERISGSRALTEADRKRLGAVCGAEFFGLPSEETGTIVLRFSPEITKDGLIVRGISEVETLEVKKKGQGKFMRGAVLSSTGELPLLDIADFFNSLPTVSQRRSALFDAVGELRKPVVRDLEAASEQSARKQKRSIEKIRRQTHRFSRIKKAFGTVETKVAVFLFTLVIISMFGVISFEQGRNSSFENLWDTFWYSIVTITTVGYGDKTPVTVGGKIVGLVLMGMGVIVMAAVTGQTASFLVEQQMRRREGLLKLKNLENHFIICGRRRELDRVIEGILAVNSEYRVEDIVLINNVGHEAMQPILNNSRFNGIQYINGDYIEEETLKRANIRKAGRVMILADFAQNYSQQEVDSRTVMAVLTIESLTKHVYVAAELLDEKFEKYLKLANCDEIILSREYSKMILANASSASGMSHVLMNLLSQKHGQGLESREIPEWLIGQSFGKICDYFSVSYGAICIGLLENTGNFYTRKKEALNEAQMTPDISKLVENLKSVKQLIPNNPVINPGRDYEVKKNSKAIVIELSMPKLNIPKTGEG